MKRNFMKSAAVMAAGVLSLSAVGVHAVSAEETTDIVVLGDSISAGAGLAEGEKSYVQLVEETADIRLQNFSAAGNTTQNVLDYLDDAQVQEALAQADVILVNVGVHDLMDPFMETAMGFMEEFKFEKFEDVFFASLADYNLDEMDLQLYAADLSMAVKLNRSTAKANMLEIGRRLSKYSGARVVFQNVYNPIDTIEKLDQLTAKRREAYTFISDVVSTALTDSVNGAVSELSVSYGFEVVDINSVFAGNAYRYVRLSDLDVNSTAEGHKVIAEHVLDLLDLPERPEEPERIKGDVTDDGETNAKDAAAILVHASAVGAGDAGTLDDAAKEAGDVDGSGAVDATDAAKILVYAAELGSGGNPSWD